MTKFKSPMMTSHNALELKGLVDYLDEAVDAIGGESEVLREKRL